VAIFNTICLFAGYVHNELLFLIASDVSLCFCWMHFWWCGFVCAHALIDVDQGAGNEDKKSSCSRGRDLLFNKFRNLLGDKLRYGFFMCAIIGVCFFVQLLFV
jgi:hypothetical protein